MRQRLSLILGVIILLGIGAGVYFLAIQVWEQFRVLKPEIAVGIVSACATIIVATSTVVLGSQLERNKEIEVHYRDKKTEIYDDFLREFFEMFVRNERSSDSDDVDEEMVAFLREWQRKMMLWGSQDVILKYTEWKKNLQLGNPSAKSIFLMEEFFAEMRRDLGHKNNKLPKGTLAGFILRDTSVLMALSEKNPNVTLSEIAAVEEELISNQETSSG